MAKSVFTSNTTNTLAKHNFHNTILKYNIYIHTQLTLINNTTLQTELRCPFTQVERHSIVWKIHKSYLYSTAASIDLTCRSILENKRWANSTTTAVINVRRPPPFEQA